MGVLVLLSSCTAGPGGGGEESERGGQTETLIDGETVATAIAADDGYHVTVIERGAVVFRLDMARAPGGYELAAELYGATPRRDVSVVEVKPEAGPPKLEGVNRIALFKLSRMRDDLAAAEGRPVAQDRAGCNGIGGSCGPWGACCDTHDRCLADCWEGATGGWCAAGCDAVVVACFASTTIPCGAGQIIGVGDGCKSECCDVGGNNICLADCSDATPGSRRGRCRRRTRSA